MQLKLSGCLGALSVEECHFFIVVFVWKGFCDSSERMTRHTAILCLLISVNLVLISGEDGADYEHHHDHNRVDAKGSNVIYENDFEVQRRCDKLRQRISSEFPFRWVDQSYSKLITFNIRQISNYASM